MRLRSMLLGGALAITLASPVAAQRRTSGSNTYERKTVIHVTEDETVGGETHHANWDLIGSRRPPRFSSLIKVREDFLPELRKSAEQR